MLLILIKIAAFIGIACYSGKAAATLSVQDLIKRNLCHGHPPRSK